MEQQSLTSASITDTPNHHPKHNFKTNSNKKKKRRKTSVLPKFRSKVRTFFLRTLYYQKVFPSSVSLGKQNLRHNNHFRAQLFPILIYSILNKKRFSFRNKNVYKRIQNTRKLTLFFLFICFLFILRLLRLFYYVCLVLLFHFILFYIIFCGIYFGNNFTSDIYIRVWQNSIWLW